MIGKMYKCLTRLIKKRKEKTQNTNIRNERGGFITNAIDIKIIIKTL